MYTALPSNIDKREFLAWGEHHEGRYELVRGNAVMTPPSMRVHALTRMRLFSLISARLDAAMWEIFSNFGVDTGPKSIRYPDILVDRTGGAGSDLTATAPALIVEVLSPDTAESDLGEKPSEYLRLSSLAAYLVFSQDEPKAWTWMRGDSGFPAAAQTVEADGTVRIPWLQVDLRLADVYRDSGMR
jgi:Uma2 family endonuclease